MVKGGGCDVVMEWKWRLRNIGFNIFLYYLRLEVFCNCSTVKSKGKRTECKNYKSINLLSVIEKKKKKNICRDISRPCS